jgi:two-component system, OmpR family, sensor histidine kinase KdpD
MRFHLDPFAGAPAPSASPVLRRTTAMQYLGAVVAVASSGLVAAFLRHGLALPNLSLVFLFAVLFTAVQWGLRASILASFLSVLVYDFLFVPPHYTFVISSPQDVLSLVVFLIVAVLTSNLTSRIRDQSYAAQQREARTAALYDLSRRIVGELDLDAIARSVAGEVERNVGSVTRLVLREYEGLRVVPRAGAPLAGAPIEGVSFDTDAWHTVALNSAGGDVGFLAIRREAGAELEGEQRRLVEAFADLAAIAIERARMAEAIERANLLSERERLQSLLLSSVSHDLRTPLASIIGSATSLLEGADTYSRQVRHDLVSTIRDEGERLNRFVGNLLDVTRLETGGLKLQREWIELADLVGTAAHAAGPRLARHDVIIDIDPGLPLLNVDFVLVEQVLVNVLDNAARYSAEGSTIGLRGTTLNGSIALTVEDEGVGIADSDVERVFDKFYRVLNADRRGAGTGLGLWICRAIMTLHGGAISAARAPGGVGTSILLRFPICDGGSDLGGEQP